MNAPAAATMMFLFDLRFIPSSRFRLECGNPRVRRRPKLDAGLKLTYPTPDTPLESAMARFTISGEGKPPTAFPLAPGETRIGRATDNDAVLEGDGVSRY